MANQPRRRVQPVYRSIVARGGGLRQPGASCLSVWLTISNSAQGAPENHRSARLSSVFGGGRPERRDGADVFVCRGSLKQFDTIDADLPVLTTIMITISEAMRAYGLIALPALLAWRAAAWSLR
jgi:hypothetical protein